MDPQAPQGFEFASLEGQPIEVNQPVDIAFGSEGAYHFRYGQSSPTTCDAEQFGDPNPSVEKYCFTRPAQELTPQVSFKNSSITLTEGYDSLYVLVNAATAKLDSEITVKLYLNGEFVRQEKYAPYEWGDNDRVELLGLKPGEHTLTAIAVDSDG